MIEIKKQKIKEAAMANTKLIMGPEFYKTNKAAAKVIAAAFEKGVEWYHEQLKEKK